MPGMRMVWPRWDAPVVLLGVYSRMPALEGYYPYYDVLCPIHVISYVCTCVRVYGARSTEHGYSFS